ncbi:hypothetical protein GQ600_2023 [Phytophthora cactorum]|nr:hypothetical protein GQ600_2023 [Phytophthora cactorum]
MSAPMQSLTPCARPYRVRKLFKTFVCELGSLYAKTDALVDGVQCDLFPPNSFALQRKWNPDKTLLESADATQIHSPLTKYGACCHTSTVGPQGETMTQRTPRR